METCNHRDFTVHGQRMEDGAEMHLYAECNECETKKSALVDWTRDWSEVGPVSKEEFEQETIEAGRSQSWHDLPDSLKKYGNASIE